MRIQSLAAGFLCLTLARLPAAHATEAETEALKAEVGVLKTQVGELERRLVAQEKLLEQLRVPAPAAAPAAATTAPPTREQLELEAQLARELGAPAAPVPAAPTPAAPTPITLAGGGAKYINVSFDGLFAAGSASTHDVGEIATGGHDPAQRGFTVQNAETVFDGAVDPYFRGQANLVFQIDPRGETQVELEEAYLTTTSLPHNLQAKGGMFFSEFGRLNPQHPHTWDFVDQPLVSGRFLGPDGLRNPGARLSWLLPTRFYSELFLSVQDSQGETAASFRGVPGETVFGQTLEERPVKRLGDLLFVPRWSASFDLTDTETLLVGLSGAFGPNATGDDTRTRLLGADAFWKWKPANAQAGFPFVKLQGEVMGRRYEVPGDPVHDWGLYAQGLWGFRRGWVAGLRGDYLAGTDLESADPEGLRRWRLSPDLTYYPTEFSKLRLQYNHDDREGIGGDDGLWFQFEFMIGAHGAHKF